MPPKRRRHYRRWIAAVILLLGLVWLNGPGFRLLAPRVAIHYLKKAGIRGDFSVQGSLIGGLSLSELKIEGDRELASLTIDRVIPDYQWRGLIKGRLDGLAVEGIHADLRLGLEKPDDPESPPLDLEKLTETLRGIRSKLIPLALDIQGISLAATRDGQPAFTLGSSRISQKAGSGEFLLELGPMSDSSGTEWPAQKAALLWNPDDITIARIDLFPGVSLRDFVIQLPATGGPSVEGQVAVDDAVFGITSTAGFASARIDLREGKLLIAETAKRFGLQVPATATIASLALEASGILPDPKAATGTVQVLLEDVAWLDWTSPEISLDATLLADSTSVTTRAVMFGTEISLEAEAPVDRTDAQFLLGDAKGVFSIASVPAVLAEMAGRTRVIDPNAPVPPSKLAGDFQIGFTQNRIQSASVDLALTPLDEKSASAIGVKGRWQVDQPLTAELAVEGLKAAAIYQIEPATYQATLTLDEFTSQRIAPWLAIVKVKPGGVADLTGSWSGSGGIKSGNHRGKLDLTTAGWARADAPPITAIGGVSYDWPGKIETKGLRLEMSGQTVALDAALADGLLRLDKFLWSDGENEIASGVASLPVPADFSKWRELLANDARPVEISINSRVLSLGLLKPWVPLLEQLDARSTGQLQFEISGTYSEPVIDATLEAKDLRSPARPGLPPADLKITLKAADQKAVFEAIASAPDFPAAVMKAELPFRPAAWAADPALLAAEPVSARLDLPRLDLSRFATLVPVARQLSGFLTGNVVVTGKIGSPELKGDLAITGGGLTFKDPRLPGIENISAAIDLAPDRITLKSLKSAVAGGLVDGGGSISIDGGKIGNLDIRLRGDHLPVMRNELLILRANVDVRLQGPWDRAVISGTIGTVDSVFYRDIELLPIGRPFNNPTAAALPKIDPPKAQSPAMPEPFRNWGLNLLARSEEPFLIRGNLATGEVTGSIRIGGTLGNPLPDGEMKIKNFRASLPFSTLYVRSGTATFTPANGFDPVLEIRGTAEPRPYRVTVYAYGRVSDPQLVLTSNPPLPDNEIMTLLATGTTTSGLEDPQAASSRALQLFAEELRRGRFRFGRQLRPLLGLLDRVDFSLADADPYSAESFSTATLSLTDRWFLSAGLGGEGDSRFMVIWRLSFH
ncbi:MAG: translocation/assembly module TamB domain-containing protein [Akkermansiaceae bacterium]